jgi:hypothetical protein
MNEKDVSNSILMAASSLGVTLFRTNSGKAWQGSKIRFASGLAIIENPRRIELLPTGFFDYAGWTLDGRFLGIEVKGPKGRIGEKQQHFINRAKLSGCVAGVAWTVEDVIKLIEDSKHD